MRSQAFAPRSHSPFVFMLAALTVIALAPMARADYIWVGGNTGAGGDDSWTNTNNWLSGLVPDSAGAQTARIGSGDPNTNGTGQAFATATVGAGVNATDGTSLFVSDNQINAGTLILSGGSLTVGGPTLTIGGNGNSGGFGTLSMSDGTITLTGAAAQFELGNVSNTSFQSVNGGTYLMSGGTVSFTGGGSTHLSLTIRGTGYMNMTDGTILIPTGSFDVARSGGTGTFAMSGGTISTNTMFVTTAANGFGTVLMSGGQFTTTGNTRGSQGNMYLNFTGGTYTTNTMTVAEGGNSFGTMIVNGGKVSGTTYTIASQSNSSNTNSNGTLNVMDGTMAFTGALTVASGTSDFGSAIFSGGTSSFAGVNMATGTLDVANISISGGTVNVTSIATINGTGTNALASVTMTGGRLNVTNAITLTNNAAGSSTLTIHGGAIVAGSINTSGANATGPNTHSYLIMDESNGPSEVDTSKFGQSNAPATMNFSGGTVTVGTIGAAMQQTTWNAGTFSPGDFTIIGGGASIGSTFFTASNNSFFKSGPNHHVHMDVSDAGAHDFIQMNTATAGSGTITLNGTLDVEYIGTNPVLGAIYDIMKAAVANGIVDNSTLVSHTPGIEFSKAIVTTTNANDTLELTITAIPEPGMLGLIGIGAMGLLRRRARRGKARLCRNLASSGG